MRLIDADKIVAYLHGQLKFAKLNNDRCLKVAFKHAILKLDNAPTIDAVPVVRCKDCKEYDPVLQECWHFQAIMAPVDYCSEGVRKDGGSE